MFDLDTDDTSRVPAVLRLAAQAYIARSVIGRWGQENGRGSAVLWAAIALELLKAAEAIDNIATVVPPHA